MLKRIGVGLLCAVLGYVAGGFGGGWAVTMLSSNTHDRSVEAAMTGAFVIGPLVALIGFITGFAMTKPTLRDRR